MGKSFLEHILNDRNDRAFERHPRQLSGTACALHKIVADAECNGVQCSIAVGKGFADKRDTEHLVHRVLSPEPRAG